MTIRSELIFPTILIAINIGAAIVYGSQGEPKRCLYWLSAAVLNYCVTF